MQSERTSFVNRKKKFLVHYSKSQPNLGTECTIRFSDSLLPFFKFHDDNINVTHTFET